MPLSGCFHCGQQRRQTASAFRLAPVATGDYGSTMRRLTRTKIIATVGPSSSSKERLAALFEAGVDVFRFNFSHGTRDDHAQRLEMIRGLERTYGRPIGVLADLQGPKLRIGRFTQGPVTLEPGAPFRLDLTDEPGDARRVTLPHAEIFPALGPGRSLLLDDGKIRLEVTSAGADYAETRVVVGGPLSDRKGVNLPDTELAICALTEKDRLDLAFALDLGISLVALSFVQRPEDLDDARAVIGNRAKLLAKLEKPSAIRHLDKIVARADGIMVARGDLGVEMPCEDVPVLQRRIVRACRRAGRPVVVATQMLESMIRSPTPTRAEATDVANAVYEGADAVMLSAETAVGAYPVEAATMMERIIVRAERDPDYRRSVHAEETVLETTYNDAITAAACKVAETVPAAAIITFTESGDTTLRAARERPGVPILALTSSVLLQRSLNLVWGVHTLAVGRAGSFRDMIAEARGRAVAEGFAEPGSHLVLVAGFPPGVPVNTVHIITVA
jgi:pyruvate kinase